MVFTRQPLYKVQIVDANSGISTSPCHQWYQGTNYYSRSSDMEALSPRSTNIQVKSKTVKRRDIDDVEGKAARTRAREAAVDAEAKNAKAVILARKVELDAEEKKIKTKDFASPPLEGEYVIQPPGKDGILSVPYKMGRLLGKGGFAICYEGELQERGSRRGTIYALKIVKAKMNQTKMEEKFRTELQIHAKLHHPNIVEFHRAFTFKECTYVVLELCPNGTVMDMVKKRKCLSLPEVRRIILQLCGAVRYMHARNVLHRDLKMGNLFLDSQMDLKVGDFGLAAILVSKRQYQYIANGFDRRNTLCGTPNYIAPEILQKAKQGHDHKVDIWAIGVIMFAMLTGFPPFQSSSPNEIYRKAREVDYAWPKDGACQNYIPQEAKDLVAELLNIDAEARPEVGEIAAHKFFLMHGGKAIPLTLGEQCRDKKPDWLSSESPQGDVMLPHAPCCQVGEFAKMCGASLADVIGDDVNLSVYKECLKEERDGTYPIVPLPMDMVYASKRASKDPPCRQPSESDLPVTARNTARMETVLPILQVENALPVPSVLPRRASVPSHAATLRAAHAQPGLPGVQRRVTFETSSTTNQRPVRTTLAGSRKATISMSIGGASNVPSSGRATYVKSTEKATIGTSSQRATISVVSNPQNAASVRPTINDRSVPARKASGESSRVTRSQKADPISVLPNGQVSRPVLRSDPGVVDTFSAPLPKVRSVRARRAPDKLGSVVGNEPSAPIQSSGPADSTKYFATGQIVEAPRASDRPVSPIFVVQSEVSAPSVSSESTDSGDSLRKKKDRVHSSSSSRTTHSRDPRTQGGTLIGPEETARFIPSTKPDELLSGLRNLEFELSRSLSKTKPYTILAPNLEETGLESPEERHNSLKSRPLITKWVDYTNKFGIGYTLGNGTVGCILQGNKDSPPCCIVVAGAADHQRLRTVQGYPEKYQIVAKNGASVQFLENCGEAGIKRHFTKPTTFQIPIDAHGNPGHMAIGDSKFSAQKRKKLVLWEKFARYMAKQYCQDDSDEFDPILAAKRIKPQEDRHSPIVIFHQRVGNVVIWAFADGSFQVNFPDHTKLVVSADGLWLDFYHITVAAAKRLEAGGRLGNQDLTDRKPLCYPTAYMLSGHYKGTDFSDIVKSNQLRDKVVFFRDLVGFWVKAGGMGRMGGKKGIWEGLTDGPAKHAWVSVGAIGADAKWEYPDA